MRVLLATLAVVFSVAYAQHTHPFTICPSTTDNLGISTVTVTPDSPKAGQNLTVTMAITPKQDIVTGDKLTITVKLFGIALGHVDFDTCTECGITCPLKTGTATNISATYLIPSAAPGGVKLTAEFTAKTAAGVQYSCSDIPVTMAPKMSLVEPMERRQAGSDEMQQVASWIDQLNDLKQSNPAQLAHELSQSGLAAIAPSMNQTVLDAIADSPSNGVPTVVAHGMGDSCFNPGMDSITKAVAQKTGAYAKCIPTGINQIMDTINGFLKNMDDSIDLFAQKIKADKNFANGFNAIGFSQGNSLIRGYIHKYNDPPVKSFISVHGTVMGVSGVPQCRPAGLLGVVCEPLAKLCGVLGYSGLVQKHLFQADYFRDPTRLTSDAYKKSQLAVLNNEGDSPNPDYKINFGKTQQFVMVKAMADTMVYPNEAEHWGALADGSFKEVLSMKDTTVYKNDLFGLKTADEAGKIHFEQTTGNHLQFTETELFGWISKYWA